MGKKKGGGWLEFGKKEEVVDDQRGGVAKAKEKRKIFAGKGDRRGVEGNKPKNL